MDSEKEDKITFEDLGLDETTLAAVSAKGFEYPTPIQILAIPRLLEGDANVIAKARTGTGKTAAFGLPLLQTIREDQGHVRALVLTPTRELALQVCKEIESLSGGTYPRLAAVYGGQFMGEQVRKLRSGVEIVVGTPGRVKDHLERKTLKLDQIDYFILDEADEMLDMGFIDDIEFIFSLARSESRVLLFSATMPAPILKIASRFMGDYEIVEEEEHPEEPVLTEQRYWVVREGEKIEALVRMIDMSPDFYGLVFTQTKADADAVSKELDERGYEAAALHGDIPQSQREKILWRFRKRKTRILVATDVAARGIDIEGLTHVVNYAMPFDGPTYVHRIGRTGRAGAKGLAFTLVRPDERRKVEYLRGISKGNLQEGKIPSVAQVLEIKKQRLFEELRERLGLVPSVEAEDESAFEDANQDFETGAETAAGSDGSAAAYQAADETGENMTDSASAGFDETRKKKRKKPDSAFVSFARELCADAEPVEVLAGLIADVFGDKLDPERYGDITVFQQGGAGGKKQTRLYVGLGRRDHMGRPEIARFFSDLLRIPNRLVDNIEITDSFSLVSLPPEAAEKALQLAKKDKRLPHMHIDVKAPQGGGFSGGRKIRRSDSVRHSDRGRPGRGPTSSVHADLRKKTGDASLYKRAAKPGKRDTVY